MKVLREKVIKIMKKGLIGNKNLLYLYKKM